MIESLETQLAAAKRHGDECSAALEKAQDVIQQQHVTIRKLVEEIAVLRMELAGARGQDNE
jgi:uncharacterized coiled-coil protein SlyX